METKLEHILIFKTNIRLVCDNCRRTLDADPAIQQWSVDSNDTDCVLRIVSETLKSNDINNLIYALGYECSELE